MPKRRAVDTAEDALRIRGATEREINVWRLIARPTAAAAWNDSGRAAVNWRYQCDRARQIGIGERQFRRIEARLEGFGVIARATADNGWRGPRSGRDVQPQHDGLSVEPAIANYLAFTALVGHSEFLEQERARMVADARAARARLGRTVAGIFDADTRAWALAELDALGARRPQPLRSASLEAVQQWTGEVLALETQVMERLDPAMAAEVRVAEASPALPALAEGLRAEAGASAGADSGSGARLPDRKAQGHEGAAASPRAGVTASRKPPPPDPRDRADIRERAAADLTARERKDRIARIVKPALLKRLTDPVLREIASEDAAMYMDVMDWRQASAMICRELGIHTSAWREAVEAMSEEIAFVALLVIDRSRFHPTKPTKQPGGLLRSMAARSGKSWTRRPMSGGTMFRQREARLAS